MNDQPIDANQFSIKPAELLGKLTIEKQPMIQDGLQVVLHSFQSRVFAWVRAAFGDTIAYNKAERNRRFLEESLELVQCNGMTIEGAYDMVNYVFARPAGTLSSEVGGVSTTFAALCECYGIKQVETGEAELISNWGRIEQIRAKQANKPSAVRGDYQGEKA